jgi:hypothetical protein
MAVRILHNDYPQRSVAIVSSSHALVFRQLATPRSAVGPVLDRDVPQHTQLCGVEFSSVDSADLEDFTALSYHQCLGCLGLINIGRDTFLCVVTSAKEVAQVRPGESVYRILAVEFRT